MKKIARWVLIIIGAIIAGFAFVLIKLGLSGNTPSATLQLLFIPLIWIGSWIGSGLYFKEQNKVKQPFAWGFMVGMVASYLFITAIGFIFPSQQELVKKAEDAEQQYFLLSKGSLDHSRICDAARDAYTYYEKAKIEDKTKLFEYIVITDKCL